MRNSTKVLIVAILVLAVMGVLLLKQSHSVEGDKKGVPVIAAVPEESVTSTEASELSGSSTLSTGPVSVSKGSGALALAPEAVAPEEDCVVPEAGTSSEPCGETVIATLPRLVSLGAGKCIPCKKMEPIRAELRVEYAGRLIVDFYDVWENPQVGYDYRIRAIPTLIFYDALGEELGRYEGFMSKRDILATWKKLGVDLNAGAGT